MPNWCINSLKVHGKRSEVLRFYCRSREVPEYYRFYDPESIFAPYFRFSGLIPIPEAVLKLSEIYQSRKGITGDEWRHICLEIGGKDPAIDDEDLKIISGCDPKSSPPRYTWCCRNWSTKWDITESDVTLEGTKDIFCLTLEFETAWGAPWNWLGQASEIFPDLRLELEHRVCELESCGVAVMQNGHLIETAPTKCYASRGSCATPELLTETNPAADETTSQEQDMPQRSAQEDEADESTPEERLLNFLERVFGGAQDDPEIRYELFVILQEPSLDAVLESIPGENRLEQQDALIASWDVFLGHLRAYLRKCLRQNHPQSSVYVASGCEDKITMQASDGRSNPDLEESMWERIREFKSAYGSLVKIPADH